jgi:hypothetical protein
VIGHATSVFFGARHSIRPVCQWSPLDFSLPQCGHFSAFLNFTGSVYDTVSQIARSFRARCTPQSKKVEALRFLATLREVETHFTPGLAPQVGQGYKRSLRIRSWSGVSGSVAGFKSWITGQAAPEPCRGWRCSPVRARRHRPEPRWRR